MTGKGARLPFSEATGDWSDRPAVVVGGGPSLIGYDFNKLRNLGRTIGANKVALSAHTDVACSIDQHFIRMMRDDLAKFIERGGEGYFACPENECVHVPIPGATYLIRDRTKGVLWSRTRLNGVHTGYACVALAASLGAKEIHVVGIDMNFREESHWHGGYSWHRPKGPRALNKWVNDFEAMQRDLDSKGVEAIFYTTSMTTPRLSELVNTRPLESLPT